MLPGFGSWLLGFLVRKMRKICQNEHDSYSFWKVSTVFPESQSVSSFDARQNSQEADRVGTMPRRWLILGWKVFHLALEV